VSSSHPPNPPAFPQPFILAVLSLPCCPCTAVQEVPTNYSVITSPTVRTRELEPKKWLVVLYQLQCSNIQ
jgi:hypothetical protein